jgi:YidC/Oxa1 family membrane protein insertase
MWAFLESLWKYLLYYPFLNLLIILFGLFSGSLGWAVIVLAAILRLAMIPLSKKQTNMTVKMGDLKPRLDKLQEKYKNNPEALAKEQMKLYKEVGYNPLGCLGSFIPQILVFMALIAVIRAVSANDFTGVLPMLTDWALNGATELPAASMMFFGIDLSDSFTNIIKTDAGWVGGIGYLILATLVGLSQLLSIKISQYMQQGSGKKKKSKGGKDDQMSQDDMQASMMKSMNFIFPIMTFSTALSTPAVLGLYWLVQVVMQVVVNFMTHKEKTAKAWNAMLKDSKMLSMVFKPIDIKKFMKKDKKKKSSGKVKEIKATKIK